MDAAGWPERREELLELFRTYEFGRRPECGYTVTGERIESCPALNGSARRERYNVKISTFRGSVTLELALLLPLKSHPVPTVLLLSNHDRQAAPPVPMDRGVIERLLQQADPIWAENTRKIFSGGTAPSGAKLLDISRDETDGYWAVEEILSTGRAAAAFYASQAQPDDRTRFPSGLTALFSDPLQSRPPDGWGTLGVWAFAASCMVDFLQTHPAVDSERISLAGHSRGGKAVLWCAAQDARIRAVLVNNSGCSGAAVSRGKQGEVVGSINAFFPHWFCPNYDSFSWHEEQMPFDQHQLVAAVAPRLCLITSGSEDFWSDPHAEWLGAKEGSSAWTLFGWPGLTGPEPQPNQMLYASPIAYHKRAGGHDLTAWDWKHFMEFLNLHNG